MSNWISVKERLPEKDWQHVLAYIHYTDDYYKELVEDNKNWKLKREEIEHGYVASLSIRTVYPAGSLIPVKMWVDYDDEMLSVDNKDEQVTYWMPYPDPPEE